MSGEPQTAAGSAAPGISRRAGDAVAQPTIASRAASAVEGAPPGLREALLALEARERDVIELHSIRGLSFTDVARALGLPGREAAQALFDRAVERLGELLDAEVAGLG